MTIGVTLELVLMLSDTIDDTLELVLEEAVVDTLVL